MARAFFSGHNYQINLADNQDGTERYRDMFAFLRQSRINHVLTHAPVIYETYLTEFWMNARHVTRAGGEVITSKVSNQVIEFTAEDLRRILQLGSVEQEGGVDGPTVYDRSVIIGGLKRMGFAGDTTKSTLFKKGFFGRWRYLAHVLLVGLSNKKTGWDTLSQEAQAQLVGIVYNKPYSFSRYFFNEIRKQISARGTARFLMYPRFVMMVLNDKLPGLPVVQPVVKVTTLVKRSYNEFITRNAKDPNAQDVELFGAIVDRRFVTPNDEEIASFEELPGQPQRQPITPAEVVTKQVNVMLDEQAANPEVAQAVIHEVLQEHAPIDDPVADTEAFHEDVGQDEGIGEGSSIGADKGKKKAVDEAEGFQLRDEESSDSDNSDDDDDNEEPEKRPKLVRIGLRVVSTEDKLEKIKKRKVREEEDEEYVPEEEEVREVPLMRTAKQARVEKSKPVEAETERVAETVIPVTPTVSTPTLIATPSQFQLNDLNNKIKVMEGMVRALTKEMEKQKKKQEVELEKQRISHQKEMELMKKRFDILSGELEKEKVKSAKVLETRRFVDQSELEEALERVLKKKKIVSDEGCREEEVMNEDDDEEDDAARDDEAGPPTGDVSKALVVFKGESAGESSQQRDKGKAPVVKEISSVDNEEGFVDIQPLNMILTEKAVERMFEESANFVAEMNWRFDRQRFERPRSSVVIEEIVEEEEEAAGTSQKISESTDEPGLVNTSSSEHESIAREVQLKYGHDKLLAENVYADLMEKKFQEETAVELKNKNKDISLDDSLSSSDSEYVPNR